MIFLSYLSLQTLKEVFKKLHLRLVLYCGAYENPGYAHSIPSPRVQNDRIKKSLVVVIK